MSRSHLCDQPMNITKRACCTLMLFLNDTERVPPCNDTFEQAPISYKPAVMIDEPPDEREDHFVFFIGMFSLILIALACTMGLSKLTKPKRMTTTSSTYDILMWLSAYQARNSMHLFLHSIGCRRNPPNSLHQLVGNNISVVSSNVPLLPSYQSATTTTSTKSVGSLTSSNAPPPPYSN